jgi:hypothetical protein
MSNILNQRLAFLFSALLLTACGQNEPAPSELEISQFQCKLAKPVIMNQWKQSQAMIQTELKKLVDKKFNIGLSKRINVDGLEVDFGLKAITLKDIGVFPNLDLILSDTCVGRVKLDVTPIISLEGLQVTLPWTSMSANALLTNPHLVLEVAADPTASGFLGPFEVTFKANASLTFDKFQIESCDNIDVGDSQKPCSPAEKNAIAQSDFFTQYPTFKKSIEDYLTKHIVDIINSIKCTAAVGLNGVTPTCTGLPKT